MTKAATLLFKSCFLVLTFFLLNHSVFGQCPIANSCTPGTAPSSSFPFGMGIYNITVSGGITGFSNPTTGGASQGYQDYSCTQKATVLEGVSTSISVTTNPNANENVKVWLDMNNNGVFDNATELIFSSVNAKVHTGSFTIPVSASVVKNTVLRLRVSADNFSSPLPTPCSTPQYSQVEDYGITVVPNTNKPTVAFSVNNPVTCSPTVQFQNQTQNGATSYLWHFGNGTTSTLANPSHTYAAPGTYSVKLKACNTNGCDSLTRTNYITYQTNLVLPASCSPVTTNYCCGYGITNVNFGNGLMVNASANGSAGYEDFTCTKSATVVAGSNYPISISTGSNPQDTKIYIDLNNDGNFTGPNEMVLQLLNQVNPSGTISIPGTSNLNIPLRMRIVSDAIGMPLLSCGSLQNGQAEDYSIIITSNTNPNPVPLVAQFTSNHFTACDRTVQFTDQSTNAPTSWFWNFGDTASGSANTSNLRNPIHTYTNTGSYTVTLRVIQGTDTSTISKTNLINVTNPCPSYCTSQNHSSNDLHINNVTISNLNHSSGKSITGYSNFTDKVADLIQGSTVTLQVGRTSLFYTSSVTAWIDFNQNGIFELSERVMAVNAGNVKTGVATSSVVVPANAALGPTRMRITASYFANVLVSACMNQQQNMDVEDYTIKIHSPNEPPLTDFFAPNSTTCNGTVTFIDKSSGSPTSRSWNFGDPASGSANIAIGSNPTHTFSGPGNYTITLTTCNANGCNTVYKSNYIVYPNNLTVTPASCTPQTIDKCCNKGIFNVTYAKAGINNTTGNSLEGYQDYSCSNNGIVKINEQQTLQVKPFDPRDKVLACIDFNNDGVFGAGETLNPGIGSFNPATGAQSFSFNFPANVVKNVYLRMRIISEDSALTLTSPCSNVQKGQVEDYAIKIIEPVITSFTDNSISTCSGIISFTDSSFGTPTSWNWNFGDPSSGTLNTSATQNPTHTFTASGYYLVSLEACNSNGCNTLSKNVYVGLNQNISLPPSCQPVKNDTTSGLEIKAVNFANINNFTHNNITGYANYSCTHQTNLIIGKSYPVQITSERSNSSLVQIWIDYDNNGIFDTWERVFTSTSTIGNHVGNITIAPPGPSGKNTFVRMRVMSAVYFHQQNKPCDNLLWGETEDYAVMLVDPTGTAENNFANAINIYPNPGNGTFTLEIPTVFKGEFQLEVQNLIGQKVVAQHLKQTGNISQVNLDHLPKGVYMLRVFNEEVSAVKKIVIE